MKNHLNLFTLLEQQSLLPFVPEHIQRRSTRHSIQRFVQENENQFLVELKLPYRITVNLNVQKVEVYRNGQWELQLTYLPVCIQILFKALKAKNKTLSRHSLTG